jgi:DNA-binding CsgD family transcriptional regulator/PAS domain-containing protein
MVATDQLPELLGLVYDAALDWQAWPVALTRLADAIGGWAVRLGVHDTETQAFTGAFPRTDPAYVRTYLDHWASRNTTWQRAAQEPTGAILRGYEHITREELVRTEFYNDWIRPQEIDWVLGAKLLQEGSTSAILTTYRPLRLGDFDAEQIAFWRAFVPHLQRALQLQLRLATLEAKSASSLEVLNRLRQGVLLVDAAAKVIFANRSAEAIFTEGDGLRSGAFGLHAATPAATAALRKLIAECAGGGKDLEGSGGPIALPRAPGRKPLNGLVIPLRATTGWLHFSRPAAIVFITDPEREHAVRKAGLQRQFGLTQAEAAFVIAILRGEGLQASADALGISVTTARTHLTHVFEKTGTRRQAELVHLILQNQAAVTEP